MIENYFHKRQVEITLRGDQKNTIFYLAVCLSVVDDSMGYFLLQYSLFNDESYFKSLTEENFKQILDAGFLNPTVIDEDSFELARYMAFLYDSGENTYSASPHVVVKEEERGKGLGKMLSQRVTDELFSVVKKINPDLEKIVVTFSDGSADNWTTRRAIESGLKADENSVSDKPTFSFEVSDE